MLCGANKQGRSSAAVSSNSFVRGCLACVMSQIARPIQDAIGDGGLYTIFAGLLTMSSLGIMLVARESPKTLFRGILISDRGERIRMNGNKWSNKFPDQEIVKEDEEKRPEEESRIKGNQVVEPERRT